MTKTINYPEKIRIGYEDNQLNFVVSGIDDRAYGEFSSGRSVIKIDDSIKGRKRGEIILHEVLHGCFFHSALSEADIDRKHEELIAGALSRQLAGVFRDNPQLIKALMKI